MSKPPTDRVVTATVRGSSADESRTADQNSVAVRDGPLVGATIVAIAGGHGHTRGSHSHIGARIAADVAATKAEAAVAALPSTDAGALAALGDLLAARIVEQWQAQVRDHIAAQPAAVDDTVVDVDTGETDANPLAAYGTGLLLAIVTPAALLALQLGEGDIVLRTDDGETARPLAVDTTSDSSDADSLALADAQSHFRHAAVDRTAPEIALVLIAAGLSHATADPDWLATFAADLDTQAEELGIDSVEEQLPGRVASAAGGGDDVTVALIFPTAAAVVPAGVVPDAGLAATIANPAVAAAASTAATPAVTTSELPAVIAPAPVPPRRRPWIMAAVTAGVALLAIGLVLALSRDKGSTTPATTVTTTRGTSTTVPTTSSTSPPPSSAAPSSAPSTAPPPTTLPVVVPVPTTAAPPRTTTPPPPATTTPPPTTVPVTSSSPPTT